MNGTGAVPRRPSLQLRIGVTGARALPEDQRQRLSDQLVVVLRSVRQEIECLARHPMARGAYRQEADGSLVPHLRLISPLAEGADRLAVEMALAEGYALSVVTPFSLAEYETDFKTPESVAQFRALMDRADGEVLQLDGGRDDPASGRYDEARSYEAVGRLVVRNCDLLIAIWDGKPGKGRGGTADTVRFSANFGPPVWWIHAEADRPPAWVDDVRDLTGEAKPGAARAALRDYLTRLIVPDFGAQQESQSISERALHVFTGERSSPFLQYLNEGRLPQAWYWQAHTCLLRVAGRSTTVPGSQPVPPSDPAVRRWYNEYQAADLLSGDYGARYRSVYVWVFVLGAFAVFFAALSLAFGQWETGKIFATALEFLALVVIFLLVWTNLRHDWHQRWIDYRLLAELCRKQLALTELAWSLPGWAVQELAEQNAAEECEVVPPDRAAWVAWYFTAMIRGARMPRRVFDSVHVARVREILLDSLILDQLHYHEGRRELYERASSYLVQLGWWLFSAVVLVVLVKLAVIGANGPPWLLAALGVLAVIVPALAAASVGIRAYAELELLAAQSRHMQTGMRAAEKAVAAVDVTRPLASQELGVLAYGVATAMLQDVEGWARLFRVKVVEAG